MQIKTQMSQNTCKLRNIFINLTRHEQYLLKKLLKLNAGRSSKHNENTRKTGTLKSDAQLGPEHLMMFWDYEVGQLSLLAELVCFTIVSVLSV